VPKRLSSSVLGAAIALTGLVSPAVAAETKIPVPTRVTLPNGLTLLVVERHNLPIVSVSAVVRAGDAFDPADKGGLASLTADLLQRGTAKRSAPQIAEAIDFIGANMGASATLDSTNASLSVLKKDLGTGLDVFADVLTHPSFPGAELKRASEEAEANLKLSLDDADTVARLAFDKALLGTHPYGRSGTLGSLKRIGRADVVKFYDTY
jgi:zinc protease